MKIVIEEYVHKQRMYKGKDMTKEMFFLPVIPWKWTLYNGFKVISFGYAHTEEDANRTANGALRDYNRK
jgi:hypothetical protein